MIANKIVDFCIENLEFKDDSIYSTKMLNKDILDFLCAITNKVKEDKISFSPQILDGLAEYLKNKIQLTDQVDAILEYIEDQEIVFNQEIDKICLIIDRDKGNVKSSQYDSILEICNNKHIKLYVTNPTFEFWLYLHSNKVLLDDAETMLINKKRGKKRYLERQLSEVFKGYKKSSIKFERFLPYVDLAVSQEVKYCECLLDLKGELGSNVGTLISELKSY